ncbi:MAG TPA: hypothetical protein VFV52_08385 [Bacilli bacterium]|nr:hypothetical protein [Bacilli bacterium]
MWLKIMGYLGMTVVIGLLAQTLVTTFYLAKIDAGLRASLDSTERLVGVQEAIIGKNQALQQVVSTTQAMDRKLTQTLQATQAVHGNISRINELNAVSLQLNQGMVQLGASSGADIEGIASGMRQLHEATSDLKASLAKLGQWTEQDRGNLDKIKAYTEQMNRRIPGVIR